MILEEALAPTQGAAVAIGKNRCVIGKNDDSRKACPGGRRKWVKGMAEGDGPSGIGLGVPHGCLGMGLTL
jgi:hypothetical protein